MKVYELRFLNAQGGTLLAFIGGFVDNEHALKKFAALREIPCDRAELWCDDEMICQVRYASVVETPAVRRQA